MNRASKACGPLVKWITAQMNYAEIHARVEPLKRDSFVCCEETSHRRKWTFSNDVSGVGSMKSAKSS